MRLRNTKALLRLVFMPKPWFQYDKTVHIDRGGHGALVQHPVPRSTREEVITETQALRAGPVFVLVLPSPPSTPSDDIAWAELMDYINHEELIPNAIRKFWYHRFPQQA